MTFELGSHEGGLLSVEKWRVERDVLGKGLSKCIPMLSNGRLEGAENVPGEAALGSDVPYFHSVSF